MTTAIKALFAFALSLAMLCQTTLASRSVGMGTPNMRKCCGVNGHGCPLKCQNLGCCSRGHSPVSAPSLPNPSNDDWMTLAPAPTLLSVTIAFLPRANGGVFPPLLAARVPLYQRNCAYLL